MGVCSEEALASLRSAWKVVVIDPEWGRADYLWDHLVPLLTNSENPKAYSITPSQDLDLEWGFVF